MNFDKQLQGKNVLVTGGAGFIGLHLCERLLFHGARVICFDNFLTGSRVFIKALSERNKSFICIEGDVNDSVMILGVASQTLVRCKNCFGLLQRYLFFRDCRKQLKYIKQKLNAFVCSFIQ